MALKVKLVRSMSGHTRSTAPPCAAWASHRVGRERVPPGHARHPRDDQQGVLPGPVVRTNDAFKPFGRRSLAKAQRAAAKGAKLDALMEIRDMNELTRLTLPWGGGEGKEEVGRGRPAGPARPPAVAARARKPATAT